MLHKETSGRAPEGEETLPEQASGAQVPVDPEFQLEITRARLERLERLYAALRRAGEATVRIRETQTLYKEVCRVLVEEGLAHMAWVGMVVPGSQVVLPVAHWGHDVGFLKATRHSALEIPAGLGPTGVSIRQMRSDICPDMEREARMSPWRQEARKRGYRSCAAFPLRLGETPTGALTLYSTDVDGFDDQLTKLLESLAEDMSFAIESIEREGKTLRAEESLRRSEEYYRALIENAQDIITIIGSNGGIHYVSPAAERLLGYRRSELRDRKVYDYLPAEDAARLAKVHAEISEVPGTTRQTEVRFRHKDASYRNLEIIGRSFVDDTGEVCVIINARDVTYRKAVEEAQRKDRDFISGVIDTTAAFVVVFDQDGRIILFNSTCEAATGYTFQEVRGRTLEFLFPPEEREQALEAFTRFLAGDAQHKDLELHWVTKHGAKRLISWSNTARPDLEGAGGFAICTGIDVTVQRQAELALKESEEQYRTIFESTGTAMCIIGPDAVVTFLNQEFERMTGYGAEEVEGVRRFTDFLLPEDTDSFMSYHRETGRGMRMVPIHFECRIRDRAGNTLNVLANMGLLPDRSLSVVSLIDVTRERNYERDLAETAERLKNFLTVASHELRHPITIVKGYANTLSGYMDEMPKELVMEILDDIDSSTDRLTRYVEELMDVSRVEEGRFPVEKHTVDAESLLKMTLEDMEIMGTDNPFSTRVDADVRWIDVDPEKFVQLLVILLENAVKFSPPGSPVEIALGKSGQYLEGAVLDRGRGISEEDRAKVFDRFFQVEDTMHHSTPGMGLGLYIAGEIVNAHGGTIWCESREGGGSVFKFTLPQKLSQAST